MTRCRLLVAVLTVCLLALAPAGAGQASSAGDPAATVAKKKPKCKKGNNKKKCRCPKGKTLKKNDKGFRCKKPKAPVKDDEQDPGTQDPGTQDPGTEDPGTEDPGTEDPGTVDPPPADPGAGKVRDDNALLEALKGAAFYKTYEGSVGYGSYAYNFRADVFAEGTQGTVYRLTYCDYYYATGGAPLRSYPENALWAVKEGYTHPSYPGAAFGVLQLFRPDKMSSDQVVEAAVGVSGNQAEIQTGNGSSFFEPGVFSFRPGQATSDCAGWEPEVQ